jgi:hypothetical protein
MKRNQRPEYDDEERRVVVEVISMRREERYRIRRSKLSIIHLGGLVLCLTEPAIDGWEAEIEHSRYLVVSTCIASSRPAVVSGIHYFPCFVRKR